MIALLLRLMVIKKTIIISTVMTIVMLNYNEEMQYGMFN